ncbi:MAG: Xaa-Pro peptidase family protein [Candidatus Omnitrophica bacterium]|nr:Xaa-Pro peptidase family protein [Candidatus Omnitrophota bacterium]
MNPAIKNVYSALKKKKLDGLFISSAPNISYLTAAMSRDSFLLLSSKKNIYFTDGRYTAEAKKYLKHCEIRKIEGPIFKTIFESCNALKLKRVGFEEKHLSFIGYDKLSKEFQGKIELIPTKGIIEDLRTIKSADEIKKIKRATEITILAFNFIRDFVVPGKTELEITGELERFIRLKGANSSAFDIIVASGPNSSFPHHLSSQRKIKNHEPVLIDLGVDYLGYKSDLTRVFFWVKLVLLSKRSMQL